jgi:hypothetical protein
MFLDGYIYTRLEVPSILFRKNSFYSSKVVHITSNLDNMAKNYIFLNNFSCFWFCQLQPWSISSIATKTRLVRL